MAKFLRNLILGLEDVRVSGNMHVQTLQDQFKKSFGTEIRIYKALNTGRGSRKAEPTATLASLTGSKTLKAIEIKKNNTVEEIEEQFKEQLGIGIQIMLTDGESFAPNDIKLKDVAKYEG